MLATVDEQLDAMAHSKVDAIAELVGYLLVSDGWASVKHRPIISALAAGLVGRYLYRQR